MKKKSFYKKNLNFWITGLTLIELMVVIAIIAILAMIAIPTMPGVLAEYHLKEAARSVYSDLQLAKATAIKEGSQCVASFTGSGYSIFLDINANFAQDGSDEVIKNVNWSDFKDVTYLGTTFAGDQVGFLPDCRTVNSGGGFGAGTVSLSANGNILNIILNAVGSIRIQ